ncbi:MAG TPA: HAMP domain-containing sensor histidine kinase [Nitrososphaeraceae archaeon]
MSSIAGSSEKTEVVYGSSNVLDREVQFFSNAKLKVDTCMDYTRPSLAIIIESIRKSFLDAKSRDVKLRYIAEITTENILYCKELMKIAEVRHLDGIKGNFMVSEKEYIALAVSNNTSGVASQIIYSNLQEIVEQQNYIFDTLWNKAIPAIKKIREIEEGIEPTNTEIIQDTKVSISRAYDIIKSAKEQVLVIWATSKTFVIGMNTGIDKIYSAAIRNGAIVKLLIPYGDRIEAIIKDLKMLVSQVNIKIADKSLETKITILIVDRREIMTWELRDDNIENPYEAGGLATYSNNKSIASSYATIFETLWKQTELYEQSQNFNKMQNDFINIAAHELRTPIQPILGLTEIIRSHTKDIEQAKLLEVVSRNANRLKRLTEDILDVTKIESQSLNVKKEDFNLNDVIVNAIDDIMTNKEPIKIKKNLIKLQYHHPQQDIFVQADKGRISQVIHNLLDNAVKFTEAGNITISTHLKMEEEVIVSVKDTGRGLDPEILPRLFSKFTTESDTGTGLGLFISKSIIEAHGGIIWAENSKDSEKGATFYFSLPLNR